MTQEHGLERVHEPKGWHSRGYLPHFDGGDVPQLVTSRLADSFPQKRLLLWRDELVHLSEQAANRERMKRIEEYLDTGAGSAYLRDERIAQIVEQNMLYFDNDRYRIHAWVVMPNHVHVLLTPCGGYSLSSIVHSWKSFTAKAANRILQRTGEFWQPDYFDRYIRDERHFAAAVAYVEGNPTRAGLCKRNDEWSFSSARFSHE